MGVPAFFRWLSVRYPKVILNALTEDELEYLYHDFKKDEGKEDPNEINLEEGDLDGTIQQKIKDNNPEFDNLYLDMNGIIHPCCHPQGKPPPKSEVEMFNNIFEYTDKIMKIVKPQKILYLAVDGVAPRAKMNQQRSRRFRSALEVEDRESREAELRCNWEKQGVKFTDKPDHSEQSQWDQNVITPGTEFMWRLSKALQYYVMERLQTNDTWKGVKVIFSDASIPGEGEHKILDFIRSQRTQPGYDPNTRHCIYGADADLIMLGLSTHEPHFCILREAVLMQQDKKCTLCGKVGHLVGECSKMSEKNVSTSVQLARSVQFQFVKLNVVREYLYLEFKDMPLPFPFDFERIIDDFVFLCFFVGNDFLPHLPSLHIREGAIDSMMVIYKHLLPSLGGYLTKEGTLDLGKIDVILGDIAKVEEEFFKTKKQQQENFQRRQTQQKSRDEANKYRQQRNKKPDHVKFDQPSNQDSSSPSKSKSPIGSEGNDKNVEEEKDISLLTAAELELKEKRNFEQIIAKDDISEEEKNKIAAQKMKAIVSKIIKEKDDKMATEYQDVVQLGVEGWKMRYYKDKFHVADQDIDEFISQIKKSYIEGLQWVYSYYYKGCASWYWFYPYHYAPFASDLINCDRVQIKYEPGEPATPFEQLMGVFPKQSAHAIPTCYRHLLSDPTSEIIDFYPINFRLDVNGARFAWMGVNLLPFIDRQRLVNAMRKVEKLTDYEKERNALGNIFLFFEQDPQSKSAIQQTLAKADVTMEQLELFASYKRLDLIGGTIKGYKSAIKIGTPLKLPNKELDLEEVESNQIAQVRYEHPTYERHLTKLLEGVIMPRREVEDFEIYHVDRRFFQGEAAVRMLEKILGIDASISAIYKNSNNNYGAYQNNHSQYDQAKNVRQGQSVEGYVQQQQQQQQPGKRYQRDNDNQDRSAEQYQNRRQRTDYQAPQQQYYKQPNNYQQQQMSNNQYYQQQQQPSQPSYSAINFNVNQFQGGPPQQQQQYPPQQQQYQQQQQHQQQQQYMAPQYQQQQHQQQQQYQQQQDYNVMSLTSQYSQQQQPHQQRPSQQQTQGNRFDPLMQLTSQAQQPNKNEQNK